MGGTVSQAAAMNPFAKKERTMSYRDQALSFVAGGVYVPRRDPFTGKSILFHTQSLEVRCRLCPAGVGERTYWTLWVLRYFSLPSQILPKPKAYAPSIGENPDQGLFGYE